jgi:hypothetical protein
MASLRLCPIDVGKGRRAGACGDIQYARRDYPVAIDQVKLGRRDVRTRVGHGMIAAFIPGFRSCDHT